MQTKAAKRYAAALHASARQAEITSEVASQLAILAGMWRDIPELRDVMRNPQIEKSFKAEIVHKISRELDFPQLLTNLLNLLLDKGRLEILPALSSEYQALEDSAAGRVRAKCLVAHPLTEERVEKLRRRLLSFSGAKDIIISFETDPSLLAGFVVSIDGKIIDGSLRGRLHRLRRALAQK